MTSLTITPGGSLTGRLRVPGDKSISHRALMLAALANGVSRVRGLSNGDDVLRTRAAIEELGATVEGELITGGRDRLREATTVIDCGNSSTTVRLLAGLTASFDWLTVLTGDSSVRRRPMDRIIEPLRRMGATVEGRYNGVNPPIVVRGGALTGIEYDLPVASAQVKSAILLAGLGASGETIVRERQRTRVHTEEMLAACGADISIEDGGHTVRLRPSELQPVEIDVLGDPSQAAFWVVAACITPGSDLVVENVYAGHARAGFVDVLRRMGADVEWVGPAELRARYRGALHGTDVGGDEIPGLIDEVPILAVAAAVAEGETRFADVSELRVKESDRIATTTAELSAMGAVLEERPDGIVVRGPATLLGTKVDSHGDHRIAMSMAVAALVAQGDTYIDDWDAVLTSYPAFEDQLRKSLS